MKTLYKLMLVAIVVGMLAACAPAATPTPQVITKVETQIKVETKIVEVEKQVTAPPPPTAVPAKRIALVPAGRVDQPGYIGLAGTGYLKACAQYGLVAKYWEGTSLEEWERNVRTAAQEGYDLVVGVGSTMADAIKKVAPEYPTQHFCLVDDYVGGENVCGGVAQEQEGTFLAGALMALMTTHTELEGINDKKVIGLVGGMDIPVIHRFLGGIVQGAQYIDPEVKVQVAYVGSFADAPKAKELALAMFKDQDVDIIFSVAGSFGDAGVFEAVKETGLYGVGSDVNWDSQVPGHVLTSVLKKTDLIVQDLVKREVEGNFQKGEIIYGLNGGFFDLTPMTVIGDKVPAQYKDRVLQLKQDVASGKIKVERWQ
jgi:basic membrane protein A